MADMGTPTFRVKIEEDPNGSGAHKSDDLATREAAALSSGRDLSKEQVENEHGRREALRDIVHYIVCAVVVGAFAFFVIGAVVVFWHMMIPACGWLTPEQLANLKTIGGSALVSSVLTQLGRQITSKLSSSSPA